MPDVEFKEQPVAEMHIKIYEDVPPFIEGNGAFTGRLLKSVIATLPHWYDRWKLAQQRSIEKGRK